MSICDYIFKKVWTTLERIGILAREDIKCYKFFLMADSGQSSDPCNMDGNKHDKNQAQAGSGQSKDAFGRRIPGSVLCTGE